MTAKLVTHDFGGRLSPQQALADAMQDAVDAKVMIVISIDKHDGVQASWSDSELLQRLGALDVAKQQMIDLSRE